MIETIGPADAQIHEQSIELSSQAEADDCRRPCDPRTHCPTCEIFWREMESKGYWSKETEEWTAAGLKNMTLDLAYDRTIYNPLPHVNLRHFLTG